MLPRNVIAVGWAPTSAHPTNGHHQTDRAGDVDAWVSRFRHTTGSIPAYRISVNSVTETMLMKRFSSLILMVFLVLSCRHIEAAKAETGTRLSTANPADVGLDAAKLEQIDGAVQASIDKGQLPGVVVVVVRQGKIPFPQGVWAARQAAHRSPYDGRYRFRFGLAHQTPCDCYIHHDSAGTRKIENIGSMLYALFSGFRAER